MELASRSDAHGSIPAIPVGQETAPEPVFPFAAVVGQDELKTALILSAIDPLIGGVLLRGEKGSAKTTLARGLADLLPHGAGFVELPIGSTEDRVIGSVDIQAALVEKEHRFRPGLLQMAHNGVLYVDEVNLLPDHLVNVLLDVAASGVNRVEREGISFEHPARFVLIGSMNPEEGELRPQLVDRFGLSVEVKAITDPVQRAIAVRRRLQFDEDPLRFVEQFSTETRELRDRLARSRPATIDDGLFRQVCYLCASLGVEGLRPDIVICRAAAAHAAWNGRSTVSPEDVRLVAPLVLAHRGRSPLGRGGIDQGTLREKLEEVLGPPPSTAHLSTGEEEATSENSADLDPEGVSTGGYVPQADNIDDSVDDDVSMWSSASGSSISSNPALSTEDVVSTGDLGGAAGSRFDLLEGGKDLDNLDSTAGGTSSTSPNPSSDIGTAIGALSPYQLYESVQLPDAAPTALRTPIQGGGEHIGRRGRHRTESTTQRGLVVGDRQSGDNPQRISLSATLRAAISRSLSDNPNRVSDPREEGRKSTGHTTGEVIGHASVEPTERSRMSRQTERATPGEGATPGERAEITISRLDLREAVVSQPISNLVVLVVDGSRSMGVRHRLEAAKQATIGLLRTAYLNRDLVSVIVFSGEDAQVVLRPTSSIEIARARLEHLRFGGGTPLWAGIELATTIVTTQQSSTVSPLLVFITDGRATVGRPGTGEAPFHSAMIAAQLVNRRGIRSMVVDVESGSTRLHLAKQLAEQLGATYLEMEGITGNALEAAVRSQLGYPFT